MTHSKNNIRSLALSLAGLVLCVGCSGSAVSVSGTVSYEGTPIEQGTIRFVPAGGEGPTEGGAISNGQYSATLLPGAKLVQITGHKRVGEKKHDPSDPSSPVLPVYEQVVNTEIPMEVVSSTSKLDFPLPMATAPQ